MKVWVSFQTEAKIIWQTKAFHGKIVTSWRGIFFFINYSDDFIWLHEVQMKFGNFGIKPFIIHEDCFRKAKCKNVELRAEDELVKGWGGFESWCSVKTGMLLNQPNQHSQYSKRPNILVHSYHGLQICQEHLKSFLHWKHKETYY